MASRNGCTAETAACASRRAFGLTTLTPPRWCGDERHIKWAEADAQMAEPNANDASPRRWGRDTDNEAEVEFDKTKRQNSQFGSWMTPMRTCRPEDSYRPQPRGGSTVRQREPAVDEDDLPLDDVEDSALKPRRLGQLCDRSLLTEMT